MVTYGGKQENKNSPFHYFKIMPFPKIRDFLILTCGDLGEQICYADHL